MKSNPVFLIFSSLLIIAGVYWYFFTGTGEAPPLTVSDTPVSQAQTQFQALVSELRPISFNTALFSDPRFNALVDLTTPISPETSGRLDPFAPLNK